jgi:hypothetical protein
MSLGSALKKITERRLPNIDDHNELVVNINEILDEVESIERTLAMMRRQDSGGGGWFFAKIGAYSGDGDNKFKYTWTEVEKTDVGYTVGAWSVLDGGRAGTEENGYYARNLTEYGNADTGTLGNGVAVASLVGTFQIKPATSGIVVMMQQVVMTDGDSEYWFSYESGVDGACP